MSSSRPSAPLVQQTICKLEIRERRLSALWIVRSFETLAKNLLNEKFLGIFAAKIVQPSPRYVHYETDFHSFSPSLGNRGFKKFRHTDSDSESMAIEWPEIQSEQLLVTVCMLHSP